MKRVLFVTYDFPYPTTSGGKNRAFHMLKYSGSGFKKYLFSFVRSDFKKEYIKKLNEIGVEVVSTEPRRSLSDVRNIWGLLKRDSIFKTLYFSNRVLADLLDIIAEKKIDTVHFESYYTAFYISDQIKNLDVKQIFGTENIEFKLYEGFAANAPFFLRPLLDFQVQKIKREETEFFKKADVCIAVSEKDASIVRQYVEECEIIRNGVDIEDLKYIKPRKQVTNILFVGNFTYFPNVDAVNFFYKEVFKHLSHDVYMTIIGKKVSGLSFARDARIKTIEFIPKIKDAYKEADIMVAPVRLGGGTNFKILEAFACGVPVVSLPQRLEGLDVSDRKNILIANDAQEFRSKIEELLTDFDLRAKISENARKLAEREYSWKVIGNNLANVWDNL